MKTYTITPEMAQRLNELEVPSDVVLNPALRGDFVEWTKGSRLMLVVEDGNNILVAFRKVKKVKKQS